MEATAGAAPSQGAGTGSAQSDSSSSVAKGGNSSAQTSPTPRPQGAAPPSSTLDNENHGKSVRGPDGKFLPKDPAAHAAKQEAAPVDDDPEFDFGERGKFKRSKVVEDFNRMRASQAAEAKRAAEAQKRYDAQIAHLKKLGLDPQRFEQDPESAARDWMHAQIQRQIEEAQMDPRELELKRREETIAEREERIKAEDEARTQQEQTAAIQAKADDYASQIHEALSASNLPRNPFTVARMANLMLAAARSGLRIPKEKLATRIAHQVAQEQEFYDSQIDGAENATRRLGPLLSHFKGDAAALAKALGPELIDGLRKHILQEAQSKFDPKPQTPPRPRTQKVFESSEHPNGYHTLDEWNEAQRKRAAQRR